MNSEIFSAYDSVAQRYLPPFFAPSIAEAIRSFRTVCNETQHEFYKHSTDYTLFHLGSFDAESGEILGLANPHSLGMAASFVQQLDTEVS